MSGRTARAIQWLAQIIAQATWLARERLLNHPSPTARLLAQNDILRQERDRAIEEAKILRLRLERIDPPHRPHYSAVARLKIVLYRWTHGLSLLDAARLFVLSPQTITRWEVDMARPSPRLVRPCQPLNRLPEIVHALVVTLRLQEAAWGTRKIAHQLVRLGIRLSRRSVQRILKKPRLPRRPPPAARLTEPGPARGPLRAKRPGHVWILDLFEWRAPLNVRRVLGVGILDLYSRVPIALVAFEHHPTAREVRRVLRGAIQVHGKPRHIVSDRGPPLRAKLLIRYLARKVIRWRHGAVAKPNSVVPAVVAIDRWNQGLRAEYLAAWMILLPLRALQARLDRAVAYWARYRPHQGLGGHTPGEIYDGRAPRAPVDPESVFGLRRDSFEGDGALPVYQLVRAA